jgi:tetratricopeptide (TPR) repeat protein
MNNKQPRNQRKFSGLWDEIEYLHGKILFWLYEYNNKNNANRFRLRLENLLRKADPEHESILGAECWSLCFELRGQLGKAIEHREREIGSIQKLISISIGTPTERFALEAYDFSDLSDRYDLLAILYHDAGELGKAIEFLKKSKAICSSHGIRFLGSRLLKDYLEEMETTDFISGTHSRQARTQLRKTS